jgi:DNA-binding beta-propeller fold protein YncE
MARQLPKISAILICVFASVIAAMVAHAQPAASRSAAAPAGELRVHKNFTAGGESRWDYVTVDPQARRVYVAHATKVTVFDADSGSVLGEVADTPGVHGVAIVADRNEGYASCGRDGTVVVFDLKTFKTVRKVPAGKNPDAILYDPASQRIFAFNGGSGDITVINPAAPDEAPATLVIGGKLEFGATDGAGHVYVNVEDKAEVVAIDSKQLKITGRWSISPGESPTGLAIDPARRRLFVGCGNKKMIILDADQGKVLSEMAVGSGVDGAAFDPELKLAVTANGRDGTLTAVGELPEGGFIVVQTLPTVKGARTVANDPKTHRFFLPAMIPGEEGKTSFGLVVVGAGK